MEKRLKVIYLGDIPEVAQALAGRADCVLAGWVIERDDWNTEIAEEARRLNVGMTAVAKRTELASALKRMIPFDLGVMANFGLILSAEDLAAAGIGFMNFHFGLLPENPGRDPISRVIDENEPVTGITVHWATAEVDRGPELDRRVVSAGRNRNKRELFDRLKSYIPELLAIQLPRLMNQEPGRTLA